MTGPILIDFLDHALADLSPVLREPIEPAIGLLVRACEDAAHARELWETTALRHQREIASHGAVSGGIGYETGPAH